MSAAPNQTWRIKTLLATALVLLAFGPSLEHIHAAIVRYGQTGWVAWAIALSVDGLAAYVGLVLRDRHRAGQRRWDAVLILLLTVAATVSAQVVTAQPTLGGVIVAVWPALAFLALLALIELDPARKVTRVATRSLTRTADRAAAQVSGKVTPTADPPANPGHDPIRLRSVDLLTDPPADPDALTLLDGEDRGQAIARWVSEGHGHGVMVRAAMTHFDVGATTAKNAIRAARQNVEASA